MSYSHGLKYNKGCVVIDTVQNGLVISMIGFGAASLGTILTAVGIPIALAMDVGAIAAGILTIANIRIGKFLKTKMNKHEKLEIWQKLNSTALVIIFQKL